MEVQKKQNKTKQNKFMTRRKINSFLPLKQVAICKI